MGITYFRRKEASPRNWESRPRKASTASFTARSCISCNLRTHQAQCFVDLPLNLIRRLMQRSGPQPLAVLLATPGDFSPPWLGRILQLAREFGRRMKRRSCRRYLAAAFATPAGFSPLPCWAASSTCARIWSEDEAHGLVGNILQPGLQSLEAFLRRRLGRFFHLRSYLV